MAEEQLLQTRSYFGTVEVITESHDVPRGLTPKYVITVEGESGIFEPHFITPPRWLFFVSPGEYLIKCCFLGVTAENVTVMVQAGEVSRVKFHFHGRWVEGLPKPAIAVRGERPPGAPAPVAPPPPTAAPAYPHAAFGQPPQPPAAAFGPPPGAAAAGAYGPPAGAPAYGPPPGAPAYGPPPGAEQRPGSALPALPAPSGLQPEPATAGASNYSPPPAAAPTMPTGAGYGSTHTIAPPPMPGASHLVAPPPPLPGRSPGPPPMTYTPPPPAVPALPPPPPASANPGIRPWTPPGQTPR